MFQIMNYEYVKLSVSFVGPYCKWKTGKCFKFATVKLAREVILHCTTKRQETTHAHELRL
jgi:hypothetical protein